jgi:hypothetical protein
VRPLRVISKRLLGTHPRQSLAVRMCLAWNALHGCHRWLRGEWVLMGPNGPEDWWP